MLKKLSKWFDNNAVKVEGALSNYEADWREVDIVRVVPFIL
ncbi:MAG: hypothetical protein RLZZ541_426, partial [Pseudomonadota bacterium]